MVYEGSLIVAPSSAEVPAALNPRILEIARRAIADRGAFTVALSGGSLPSFLARMETAGGDAGASFFNAWHVILADERCVPTSHPDSNLGALNDNLFSCIPVPGSQIHGINQDLLSDDRSVTNTADIAADYQRVVESVLAQSSSSHNSDNNNNSNNNKLDLAVLGFGPDGHTCSLFPGHPLLNETRLMVAPIDDSPKPPPHRITLTYPVLNERTRHVIFCGAGDSKAPILQSIFQTVVPAGDSNDDDDDDDKIGALSYYKVTMKEPCPYPCAGVLPKGDDGGGSTSLTYVVDQSAMTGVAIS